MIAANVAARIVQLRDERDAKVDAVAERDGGAAPLQVTRNHGAGVPAAVRCGTSARGALH